MGETSVHTHTHTHTHARTHARTHTYIPIHTSTPAGAKNTHTHTRTHYAHTLTYTHARTHTRAHTHSHIPHTHESCKMFNVVTCVDKQQSNRRTSNSCACHL